MNRAQIQYKCSSLLTWSATLAKRLRAHHVEATAPRAPPPALPNQPITCRTGVTNLLNVLNLRSISSPSRRYLCPPQWHLTGILRFEHYISSQLTSPNAKI
ncbi:hypothetical protein AVEN_102641-1 [Araneus ventricosus]|uniref:Uncharacterized protein n=1 Tax=Araneus ventricosus TaxID=182803 RepID=A0A4Y2QAW9_ARAVE|nr:hypothetical protein AVEN_102641-1 [Araneus ventricosus]